MVPIIIQMLIDARTLVRSKNRTSRPGYVLSITIVKKVDGVSEIDYDIT